MAVSVGPEHLPPDRHLPSHGEGGHPSGTYLDEPVVEAAAQPPSRLMGLLTFGLATAFFIAVGYQTTINQHVIVFDALDRLTRAYLIWHNTPPKLAAIGFSYPPLTTMVLLPLSVIKPVATSLVALPLTSALFGGATILMLDRALARCDMMALLRIPLLVLVAINPMFVFYAGNGMSEMLYLALQAFSLYCFVAWYETTEPRFLIGAGFAMAILVLTRYAFILWAILFAVLIGVALVRRRATRIEVEGSVIAFAAPVMYSLALWILFNALIVADPFGWLTHTTTSTQAVNASGAVMHQLGFDEVSKRLLQLNVAVFPLAFVAVPALVLTFISQRNDLALWLASFVVLGIVILGVHAYTADNEGLLTLRDSMPMMVASLVGAGWVYRSFPTARLGIWLVTTVMLIIGLFTAWHGMRTYPFQSEEQAFIRAIATGKDQTGQASRGGYRVGVADEAEMAEYINTHITRHKSVLVDNGQSFGVILLSGRPQLMFTRADKGDTAWFARLSDPYGHVDYLLTAYSSGADLIIRHYPSLNRNGVPGMSVVLRNARYLLIRVAARNPSAPKPRSPATQPTPTTPAPATGVGAAAPPGGAAGGSAGILTTPSATTGGATSTPGTTTAAGAGAATSPSSTTTTTTSTQGPTSTP